MPYTCIFVPSTDKDMQVVEKNVRKKSLNTWYEAQLLTDNGKSKRVYCYISPRVRECMATLTYSILCEEIVHSF